MLSYLIGFFVIKSHLLTVSELLLAESVQIACGLLDDLPWLSTGKTDFHGMVSFTSTIECSISSFTNTIFSFCIYLIYFFHMICWKPIVLPLPIPSRVSFFTCQLHVLSLLKK